MTTTIKETRELWAALSAIYIRTIKALADDGKISWVERGAYLADFNVITSGLSGIGQIPGELADLDETESEILQDDIRKSLLLAGITHRVADITDIILTWIRSTVDSIRLIRSLPPTALPV